jgi:hypothetical protein
VGPIESQFVLFATEKYLALMALGFCVGAYGTLIGAGGGFVLMPLLLILYPKENPEILTSISLAVVFFNALSGSEAYGLMKRIDYRSGLMFAAATVPGMDHSQPCSRLRASGHPHPHDCLAAAQGVSSLETRRNK